MEGARKKALREDRQVFLRREAETAVDELTQRDSSKLWSICRAGKRRKDNGIVQLTVLKDKKRVLGSTPQQKAVMWYEKFVDESGGRAVVSACFSDAIDVSTVEASDKGTLAHPRAVTEEEVSLAQAVASIPTGKAVGPDVLLIALIRAGGEMHSSAHLGGEKDGGQRDDSKSLAVWRNGSC